MTLPTYFRDGFLFFKEKVGVASILGDSIIVNSSDYSQITNYVNEKGIKSIRIIPAYHQVDSLNFLKDIKHIEGLYILQSQLDLTIINDLIDLRVLRIDETKAPIDFNNLPKIEVLGITSSKNTINIPKCKRLFWLWLDNFKSEDLREFSELENLQYLFLHKTAIKNLLGVEKMYGLKEIHINVANKLESLFGLSEENKHLEFLDIYSAKILTDYSSISSLKTLKKLFLSKTGETNSLSFLSNLDSVEEIGIGMKVLDGNMTYLASVPNVSFLEFPHYNLKMKDFKKDNASSV